MLRKLGVLKFGSAPIISRNDQFCADIVRTNKSSFLLNYMAKVSSATQCCQFCEKDIFSDKFYESDKKIGNTVRINTAFLSYYGRKPAVKSFQFNTVFYLKREIIFLMFCIPRKWTIAFCFRVIHFYASVFCLYRILR